VLTATNKRLLISESHGNSNWCTPSRGNPSNTPHASQTIRISRGQGIAAFHIGFNRFKQIHCSWEEGLLTQPTTHRLTGPRVRTQLLSHNSQWSSGEKTSFCRQLATRLTGPISPACDRYDQYLLAGATHWSLTDTGEGYNLGDASLPHLTPWPSQLMVLHFPPKGPAWSQVIQIST
jgi:hypothetical protein